MLRQSEQTQKLLEQLYPLQTACSSFVGKSIATQTIALVQRIAEQGEAAAVPGIARSLFSELEDVRKEARRAIHQLLAPLAPTDLLHLSVVSDRSYGWWISAAWDQLQPADVTSLIADDSYRSTLLGLVSFHRNGYVRHEAVRLLAGIADGSELPFLLIRQNDWVNPISTEARAAVQSRLENANLPAFLRCLPLIVHLLQVRRHDQSSMVHRVVAMLLQPEQDVTLAEVLRSSNRDVRREVCRLAINLSGEHQPRVVLHGLGSPDAVMRYWCACKVRDCFSLEALDEIIPRLQQDRYMPVRRESWLLAASVHPESSQSVWQRAMLDVNASIRNLARFHLQKVLNFNAAGFYRDQLAAKGPTPAMIYGLGETGDASDLPTLRGILTSRLPGWRRAAIRGLAALGKSMSPKNWWNVYAM